MQFVKNGKKFLFCSVPSIQSWIKTIEGFQNIVNYLHSLGMTSLLLRHFNQDSLENFFGAIRAHGYSNIMPSALAFESAYKTLYINNFSSPHSVGGNCERDMDKCLQSLKYFLKQSSSQIPYTHVQTEIDPEHLNIPYIDIDDLITSPTPEKIERTAALGYCSGWLLKVIKRQIFKNCLDCKASLEADKIENFHNFIKFSEYSNKTWLSYPKRCFFDIFVLIENIVSNVLSVNPCKNHICNYIEIKVTIYVNFNFIRCVEHKEKLVKFILKKVYNFF